MQVTGAKQFISIVTRLMTAISKNNYHYVEIATTCLSLSLQSTKTSCHWKNMIVDEKFRIRGYYLLNTSLNIISAFFG